MNPLKRTIISALAAGAICMVLKAAPYILDLNGDDIHRDNIFAYNERLKLLWFLSLAIPGVFISIILGYWAKCQIPQYAVVVTWSSGALFSVAMPAPAILNGSWADGLTFWYIGFASAVGGLWGWNSHHTTQHNRAPCSKGTI